MNGNGLPDECEPDCSGNGVPDDKDIADATSVDVNANGIPDECETDCNANGVPDDRDVSQGTSADCNGNGRPDECDIAGSLSPSPFQGEGWGEGRSLAWGRVTLTL